MVIISDYELIYNSQTNIICKSHEAVAVCPICGGKLRFRDKRKRIMRQSGGNREYIQIRRLKCARCGRLHNEMPDCLVPHKHYAAKVIEDVVDEALCSDDFSSENYPCERTMQRWRDWMQRNHTQIDGCLKSVAYRMLDYSDQLLNSSVSLLEKLIELGDGWLRIIHRIVYNSGGSMAP